MENAELVKKAIDYVREKYDNAEISIRNVADHAGFSIDYFNRIFLTHTGFTVMAYVNYMRMKRAITFLRSTDKTVLEIALEVGYDSHEGFIKAFRKVYGMTPSDYRRQNHNKVLSWGELTDSSCGVRFLHTNPDFEPVNSDFVIDYLLEKDSKRYGYFCTTIKSMGLEVAAPSGNFVKGFIGIGDDRKGGMWLELISDDIALLSEWITRFTNATTFYSNENPDLIKEKFRSFGIYKEFTARPQSLYLGNPFDCILPENIIIRELTFSDKERILKWANGKTDGYIKHLLTEYHYYDPSVLEYGVFEDGELIAAVGCGIEEVHGFRLNDSCNIRFAEGKANDGLYRSIFEFVVNDVMDKGLLPFDDLQYGEYAKSHGGFTAEDAGFTVVNWRYNILG